jgi:hypothetical protein
MDIHKPKPVHSWRELASEIGVVVVGILIAIGLEQAVEALHHSHQREQLVVALRRDGEANRGYVRQDIATAQAMSDWALQQASTIEHATPTGALAIRRMPSGSIGAPDGGVWLSAKASGITSLLPSSAQNWVEYLSDVTSQTFTSSTSANGRLSAAYAALDQVVIGRTAATPSGDVDLSGLTADQRFQAVECLRAIAEHARVVLRQLVIYDASNEFILSTPLDQLDTLEAAKRYEEIRRKSLAAHASANYTFGGR